MKKRLLQETISKKGVTLKKLAKRIKCLKIILYFKLQGIGEFTLGEIDALAKELNLSNAQVNQIFFGK